MKILWDVMAEEDLHSILECCDNEFGLKVSRKIYRKIKESLSLVSLNPKTGSVIAVGKETGLEYRSLIVHKQNNVIYSVHEDYIYVHMICNTREFPGNYMVFLK